MTGTQTHCADALANNASTERLRTYLTEHYSDARPRSTDDVASWALAALDVRTARLHRAIESARQGALRIYGESSRPTRHAIEQITRSLLRIYPDRTEPHAVVTRTAAARDVLVERNRQIAVERRGATSDDQYTEGELPEAAVAYAVSAAGWDLDTAAYYWPSSWAACWFKPTTPRRDLVRAAALILAEIERIDRAAGGIA